MAGGLGCLWGGGDAAGAGAARSVLSTHPCSRCLRAGGRREATGIQPPGLHPRPPGRLRPQPERKRREEAGGGCCRSHGAPGQQWAQGGHRWWLLPTAQGAPRAVEAPSGSGNRSRKSFAFAGIWKLRPPRCSLQELRRAAQPPGDKASLCRGSSSARTKVCSQQTPRGRPHGRDPHSSSTASSRPVQGLAPDRL